MENKFRTEILSYFDKLPKLPAGLSRSGSPRCWYDCYYAITRTFTREQVEHMSDAELFNLVKLARNITAALY